MKNRVLWQTFLSWTAVAWIVACSGLVQAQTVLVGQEFDFYRLMKGFESFPSVRNNWGMENLSFANLDNGLGRYMRVFIPKGAIDPGTMSKRGLPRGGAGFKSQVFPQGVDRAFLSYRVRFSPNFNFVLGGKLPGLYGGVGNSGGIMPNGTDGFSVRLMWGNGGAVQVYAYLPSSIKYGTAFFRRPLTFLPGQWHKVAQELTLNDPGQANGQLRLWIDDVLIGEQTDLVIRTGESLHINGLFFDVFFGGNDDQWAPPNDVHIDFADFLIRGLPIHA
jgi:hypothetical protein